MLVAIALWIGEAQEIDTALRSGTLQHTTVLDQIDNRREQEAFLAFYGAKKPDARYRLAKAFLDAYPRSWFLAEAYEVAAKASIDLGRFEEAIAYAHLSLRLFPENPLLLVPLANVEAQQGQSREAERDGKRALELLDEFGPPSGIDDARWPELRQQLRGSAHFAVGRAYATRGLKQQGSERDKTLQAAYEQLTSALAENRSDPEAFLLRGMMLEAQRSPVEAASNYAEAARLSSSLHDLATSHLRRIFEQRAATGAQVISRGGESFDEFIKSLPPPAITVNHGEIDHEPAPLSRYAGSIACRECHRAEFDAWQQTGMARMFRPYRRDNVLGDFRSASDFRNESGAVVIRLGMDTRPYFLLRAPDGLWQRFQVDYTIGSKWQQAYATRLSDGRIHVLPIQYNRLQGRWLNYWKLIDPPGSPRADANQFAQLRPITSYQLNCAPCHTSQLRAYSSQETALENAEYAEAGINCEMCHGPSQDHVDRMHRGIPPTTYALKTPVDFRKIDNRAGVRICAQCHRQSAIRKPNAKFELNYSSHGTDFVQHTESRSYPEFLRRAFYKDGRFRETTFIVEAFTRSQCYRAGAAQCSSCHNPHPADAALNPVSLKFDDRPDETCLQCHSKMRRNLTMHTHHPAEAEASRCVSCHMPKIMNGVMFQARSHQIDDIPDGEMTERFGPDDSPNACLSCHKDQSGTWVRVSVENWRTRKEAGR